MKCIICGKEIEQSSFNHKVICSSECFDIDFWNDKVLNKSQHLIIEGGCYFIGQEEDIGRFRGYDGRKFVIQKDNGEIITTTNLWYNGRVPETFTSKLPNNAKWYTGPESKQLSFFDEEVPNVSK